MKKKLLFVLFAVLTLAVGATSSVIERTGKSIKKERTAPARQVAKANADKSPTVYGWLRYVEHAPSDQQYGVCRFNAGDPSTVDVLFPFDAEHQACAGAAANGVYYVYRYTPGDYAAPVDFGTVNLTTGAFTKIADYSRLNALFADMTFDYSTQTMYALANVGSSTVSTLVTVNLTNGDVQNVATLAEKFVALACSYDGQLYAIKGDDGYLYKINKTNGDLESIGYTYEEPAEYFQSMEFDHSTETLYWAANTIYEEGFLTVVNIANGNSERTGTISENAQVVGLHIPFVRHRGTDCHSGCRGRAERNAFVDKPHSDLRQEGQHYDNPRRHLPRQLFGGLRDRRRSWRAVVMDRRECAYKRPPRIQSVCRKCRGQRRACGTDRIHRTRHAGGSYRGNRVED